MASAKSAPKPAPPPPPPPAKDTPTFALQKAKYTYNEPGKNLLLGKRSLMSLRWIALHSSSIGIRFRINVSMLQVLSSIGPNFSIPFPDVYSTMLRWLSIIELDLRWVPLSCFIDTNYHVIFSIQTLVPFMLTFLLFIAEARARPGRAKSVAGGLVYILLYLAFPSCSKLVFGMFDCVNLEDGTRWLRRDLTIDCDSTEHSLFGAFAVILLFVYPIGVPCYFAYLLYWRHATLLDQLKKREYIAKKNRIAREVDLATKRGAVWEKQRARGTFGRSDVVRVVPG